MMARPLVPFRCAGVGWRAAVVLDRGAEVGEAGLDTVFGLDRDVVLLSTKNFLCPPLVSGRGLT